MLGKRGGDLSGGQQQQLAIARAISDRFCVIDRGAVALEGQREDFRMDEVRRLLSV